MIHTTHDRVYLKIGSPLGLFVPVMHVRKVVGGFEMQSCVSNALIPLFTEHGPCTHGDGILVTNTVWYQP